ncbi:hypothetical protein QFZ77_003133 [Paenibacillus sp. V4I3]|nr:hypothetical protein [Paenibacillus sp. V4I3]
MHGQVESVFSNHSARNFSFKSIFCIFIHKVTFRQNFFLTNSATNRQIRCHAQQIPTNSETTKTEPCGLAGSVFYLFMKHHIFFFFLLYLKSGDTIRCAIYSSDGTINLGEQVNKVVAASK